MYAVEGWEWKDCHVYREDENGGDLLCGRLLFMDWLLNQWMFFDWSSTVSLFDFF